jgi:hypothetical protein
MKIKALWFTSTLTLYQHLNDDFWEQGFALHCLFIKPEKKQYESMSSDVDGDTAILGITTEIIPLFNIEVASATEEWW